MALSDARDYVLAVESNKHEATEIAKSTAQKLESRQTTLIDVVQSLGEYINDGDEKIRARAVSYLVAVISSLPPKFLSRQQIQVLCQFLCDRIEDGGALDGLSRLQGLDRFTNDLAQTVMRAVLEHFADLQTRNQAGRYRVLQLLNELLDRHRKAIRDMGDESLVGITELVAGEKDPRNLMLIFSMLRVLMVEWDITRHVEMMFDSVYAYFPITFRPPPNDPYGITAQDLKDRLRDCLAATPLFAPFTFPNMLDRLDSTSNTVKKDVLQTLTACASNYDPATMSQYSITLWDAVKFEVLQAQEPDLAEEALRVLSGIAACLSASVAYGSVNSALLQYLKPINKECLEHLQEPASRQAKASGNILKAVSSASVQAFEIVIKAVGPALFTIYQSAHGLVQQRAVLEVTNQLFEASIEVYGSWTAFSPKNPEGRENLMLEFKDKFVALYSQALMGTVKEEVSFRLTAADGLLLISKMRSMLTDDEVGLFVQYFDDIVLTEESYGRDELKKRSMASLAEISHFKPGLISDITFPAFLARLPDSEEDARSEEYNPVLEGLAEISVEKNLQGTLMRRLLNKVDLLFKSNQRTSYPYTCSTLGTILFVLDRASNASSPLDAYYDRVVVGLSQRATEARSGPLTNETVLDLLGRIMNLIVRHSPAAKVQMAADNIYLLFRNKRSDENVVGISTLLEPPTLCLLSTWLLAAIPRNTHSAILDKAQIPRIIDELISFASKSATHAITQSCLLQLALYVNKHIETADLGHIDDLLSRTFLALKDEPMGETTSFEFNLRLLFTLVKALILRLSPKTNQYLTSLVDLLDEDQYPQEVSRKAAMGFATILSTDYVLSKKNGAQIRLLAPQRVFQMLTPLISEKFKASRSASEKENYLIAISGVLASVPSEIVMPELPTLLPLLLQSLDVTDQMVKIATLETLAVVISNNPSALEESGHIPALVKRLIKVATAQKSKSPKHAAGAEESIQITNLPSTRRLAARCLALLPKYVGTAASTVNPLLALKREVLHGLTRVLDDPKRDVRKEAVDARAAWLRGVDDINDDDV